MKALIRTALAAVASACAATALAQERTGPLEYRSAFAGYRSFEEPEGRNWRDANEEARMLGGHVGQLKSAPPMQPRGQDTARPAPQTTPAKPKSAEGHQGHGK
jgi:hypothetical protein